MLKAFQCDNIERCIYFELNQKNVSQSIHIPQFHEISLEQANLVSKIHMHSSNDIELILSCV